VFLQAIAGGCDPIKDKCLQAFLRRWPEGRPEDPHTSDWPIHSVEDELSAEALRHAFIVGTAEGIVPCGMEACDPKLHGDDMDLCRSAQALGHRHEDCSEPTTPKHFMDALKAGCISARHQKLGGPVMHLKAICAGFRPGLDGSPKVFLKQHAKGKLPPGSGRSSPITPQEFREQMVVDVCPLPVNAGAKRNSSGTATRHFVAPSGPEFDAAAMGVTVDLTGAPDSDDDMDSVEAAEVEAIDGPNTEDGPDPETNPDRHGRAETQFQPLDS